MTFIVTLVVLDDESGYVANSQKWYFKYMKEAELFFDQLRKIEPYPKVEAQKADDV